MSRFAIPTILLSVLIVYLLQSTTTRSSMEVTIATMKQSYIAGEPIAVRIEIVNRDDVAASVVYDYPTFRMFGSGGLDFEVGGAGLTEVDLGDREPMIMTGVVPYREIRPGEPIRTTVFLQRFLSGFEVGDYHIPVSFDLITGEGDRMSRSTFSEVLDFSIVPGEPDMLGEIIGRYGVAYLKREPADKREAAEPLLVTHSPEAIPYLMHMLNSLDLKVEAVTALTSFPATPELRASIASSLREMDQIEVIDTVSELASRGYDIGPEAILDLLDRDVPAITVETINYLDRIHPVGWEAEVLPRVRQLMDAPEPKIVVRSASLLRRLGAVDKQDAASAMQRVVSRLGASDDPVFIIESLQELERAEYPIDVETLEVLLSRDNAIIKEIATSYIIRNGIRGTSLDRP